MQSEIERRQAIAGPAAVDGPFEMKKGDPELISAGNRLRDAAIALDQTCRLGDPDRCSPEYVSALSLDGDQRGWADTLQMGAFND